MSMTPEEIAAEIASLEAKLKAREKRPGFTVNVAEIKARIAELQQEAS